jgi:hypothetical protein
LRAGEATGVLRDEEPLGEVAHRDPRGISTALPPTISCFADATTRVYSCLEDRAWILVVSWIEVLTETTPTPFKSGLNLTRAVSVSVAAHALCGIIIEYIILSGQVFSISRVCWYSSASEEKERRM